MGKRKRRLTREKFAMKFASVRKHAFGDVEEQIDIELSPEEIIDEPEEIIDEPEEMMSVFGEEIIREPEEITDEQIEEMAKEVELMIEEVQAQQEEPEELEEPVIEWAPVDYKKLLKAELLEMAERRGCDVTPKNTKAQIIAALEKQSA